MNPRVKKNNMIFNQLYVDFENDVVITEGVFDAVVAGPNSIPILGSTLKEGSKLIIEMLLRYDIELYKVDVSSHDDVAEMGRQEFLERKKQASFLDSENYLLYRISNFL